MKKGPIFSLLLLLPLISLSQAEVDTSDFYDPPRKLDRFIVNLGYAGWMEKPNGIDLEPWSYHTSFHYMQDIPFGESGFATAVGFGFLSHNSYHNGLFSEDPDGEEATEMLPYPDGDEPKRNKLSANYVNVPVELRFRSPGEPAFKVAVGAQIGYMINLHTKIIDSGGKRKYYDIHGVDPLRYGLLGRIGYGRLNVYGSYALTPFFEDGEGPGLIPFSLGASLTLF